MCYRNIEIPIEIKHTIDAQFNQVVETALNGGKIKENVLCCLDTSGSMQQQVNGLPNVMCCDIATSLALFFAKINKGAFHNVLMRFDSNSYPVTLESESFCENVTKLPSCPCGTTNFQSVIDEIVKIRKENLKFHWKSILLYCWPYLICNLIDHILSVEWKCQTKQTKLRLERSF